MFVPIVEKRREAAVGKHLPLQHDQKTHGKRGIGASKVTVSSKPDAKSANLWFNAEQKRIGSHEHSVSQNAISDGNLFLRDASGIVQAAAETKIRATSGGSYELVIRFAAVAPWHRRGNKDRVPGYGTRLMREVVKRMSSGVGRIVLVSMNAESDKFYRAIGMVKVGALFQLSVSQAKEFAKEYDRTHAG